MSLGSSFDTLLCRTLPRLRSVGLRARPLPFTTIKPSNRHVFINNYTCYMEVRFICTLLTRRRGADWTRHKHKRESGRPISVVCSLVMCLMCVQWAQGLIGVCRGTFEVPVSGGIHTCHAGETIRLWVLGVRMPGRMPGEGENSRSVVSPECRPGANLWLTAPRGAPVSLTRRLRRAVAVWPEEPGYCCSFLPERRRAPAPAPDLQEFN